MGSRSCKPCSFCPRSKEDPDASDWRFCPDRCCDVCCQLCVGACSGLCSPDCSYTFCTLWLALAQRCVAPFAAVPLSNAPSEAGSAD